MPQPPHYDVVIVGAGLSGIGMACHLKKHCPEKRYVILEGRSAIGGTWDQFRYPGVRADSDMFTLSYGFKPWRGPKDIADGKAILEYIRSAAREYQVEDHIRFGQRVGHASWSTKDARWTMETTSESEASSFYTCNWLLLCAGYFSYEQGHTPTFPGRADFQGDVVHPQDWPKNLDYRDKEVIVIGSGATAVSLAPVLAEQAKKVTILQRSPTYMLTLPSTSKLGVALRRWLPSRIGHAVGRWWNARLGQFLYQRSRKHPERVKRFLLRGVQQQLPDDVDVTRHFTPSYAPWDQRLCVVRDGDLFRAIRERRLEVVTAQIERFTEQGVQLESGQTLPAQLIVTATGLKMQIAGGMSVEVDNQSVDWSRCLTYKGMMNADVPNWIATFGYINASWTLRSDLIAEYTCRLIRHMDRHGYRVCTPRVPSSDREMPRRPFIADFSSNYVRRALDRLPQQGDRDPWRNPQEYAYELRTIRRGRFDDGVLAFA